MKDDTNNTKNISHESSVDGKPWRFVTNHTQVLLTIARNPDMSEEVRSEVLQELDAEIARLERETE